jgi:alpha-galactosidase
MPKITFMGAGSTVFVRNIIGDSMLSPALCESEIALYDIDSTRLKESLAILQTINDNVNQGRARLKGYLGVPNRKAALTGAHYVVNAVQIGGYEPSTVVDFEIPKTYGLRQTIADTLGIGGIFRALRTIPVMLDFARDMEQVCPTALLLNYSNPMAMLTPALLRGSSIRTVGLCHSVQVCATALLSELGMLAGVKKLRWKIAGINHMAWLLEIKDGETDLYPEIKRRAAAALARIHKTKGGPRFIKEQAEAKAKKSGKPASELPGDHHIVGDMVRLTMMLNFGYYTTESSEHNAEYTPYWIKASHPELIETFNIPLDEYPRRCIAQIAGWKRRSKEMVGNKALTHTRGHEYGSYIMEAAETDIPFRIHGNVMNTGLIPNLPAKACVEVPCMIDRNGLNPCYVGELPEPCAALNRTNINVQILAVEAALERNRDKIYQAAFMDPHTSGELAIDQIRALCDDLIKAHGKYLPFYK